MAELYQIFEIIQPDRGNLLLSRVFDWFITALILISVVCVFAVTFELPKGVLSAIITAGLTERIGREQSSKDPSHGPQDVSTSQQGEILRLVREQGDLLRCLSERIDKSKMT